VQGALELSSSERIAQAAALLHAGRATEAEALCRSVIRDHPRDAEALHMLGIIALQAGHSGAGIEFLRVALQTDPSSALIHCNLGNALRDVGCSEEALQSCRRAIELAPQFAGAFYGAGNALIDLKRFEDARASFDQAISLQPGFAEAHNNRGNALWAQGEIRGALESYLRALEARAAFPDALENGAKAYHHLGRDLEALELTERWLRVSPKELRAHRMRGHCLSRLHRPGEALASYDSALAIDPEEVETLYARGMLRTKQRRHHEALADFERALARAPRSSDLLFRRAEALRDMGRLEAAAEAFEQVFRVAPESDFCLGNYLHARLQLCDWMDYEPLVAEAHAAIAQGRRVYLPGVFLTVAQSAADQERCARIFVEYSIGGSQMFEGGPVEPPRPRAPHHKVRIAYVSADFREHPVAALLVGVIEAHDRNRFEIVGVSLMPANPSPLGQRIKAAFDRFIDVSDRTDAQVAALLEKLDIDVAVDLMGWSARSRPRIFGPRCARARVVYLGYPGTTALPAIDYIIADRVVIPAEEQRFYSEKVIYLPHSYLPSDAGRCVASETPSRLESGLPATGTVFCCFNSHYKLTPRVFQIWMEILQSVPGSVLWLSSGSAQTQRNLCRAAQKYGVAAQRLIFAARIEAPERHLARYRLADLFLDTLPFNAHATASDALWAGLPLLTCRGNTFPGRVAASLLYAVGLPELITESLDAYRAAAIRLGCDTAALGQLRSRLEGNRRSTPLFATAGYTRDLEGAYLAILAGDIRES
jgi:protein O-GlcNAc transferase